jgi:hypothetical protein
MPGGGLDLGFVGVSETGGADDVNDAGLRRSAAKATVEAGVVKSSTPSTWAKREADRR